MKRVLFSSILVVFLSAGVSGHEGMIALYSDADHSGCSLPLKKYEIMPLYLFYDRGDGPEVTSLWSFRIRKSSDEILFMEPEWAMENFFQMGSLGEGVTIMLHTGEGGWCSGDEQTIYLATLDVLNVADPDTFTMSVLENPNGAPPGMYSLLCETGYPLHPVIGGTFVFNGRCYLPEDPFGGVAVAPTTWGAMKSLFK